MDELAEMRIRARQEEIRTLRWRATIARLLRLLAAGILVATIAVMIALSAKADYRSTFLKRSLNKTIVIENGRARTIPGGEGTHYLFKETERDHHPGTHTCCGSHRDTGRRGRGTHHRPAGRR